MRAGTKAEKMPNQIIPELKEERSKKIIELSNEIQKEYNKSYIGKELKVLFEERHGEYFRGHTENYICVQVKTDKESLENKILSTKIYDMENEILLRRIN